MPKTPCRPIRAASRIARAELFLAASLLILAASACAGESPAPDDRAPASATSGGSREAGATAAAAPARSPAPEGASEEELERLRALGYLDTKGLPTQARGRGAHVLDASKVAPGSTLAVFAGACTAQLLSSDGPVLRAWKDPEPCHRWEHAELLPDGDLIAVGARLDEDVTPDPIETGRYVLRLRWNGTVVWRRAINAHHDLSALPDGRFLTLVMERRRIPAIDPEHDIADDVITWLSADGRTQERLSVYDVLASADPPFPIQKAGSHEASKSGIIDLLHTNTVRRASVPELAARSPIYGPDALILTSRHQDELLIVDARKRRLLWHWGRGVLSGPHEGSMLPNGHLLVFDNGLARGWSRVLDLDPLAPGNLVQFAPGSSRFFSRVMGSCQRLPNGNVLIVHSEGGAAFELTPQGQPVWTYESTLQTPDGHRVKIIRMRRIPPQVIERILTYAEGRTNGKD